MKSYEELLAERDALAAQIETLKSLFPLDCLVGCDGMLNYPIKKYNNVVDAFNSAPQQCFAEIKAEAGRAGFLEGVRQMCDNEIGMLGHDAESCANHYAARVRLGFEPGTWLKDSNVNGGKRQGGEK